MTELRPGPRQSYTVAQSVQRFVESFDKNLGIRQVFLSSLEDAFRDVRGEIRPKLRDEIVTSGLLPHPIQTVEAVKKATERQKKHSPLHEFLSDYSVIGEALRKYISNFQTEVDAIFKLAVEKQVFKKVFISLCPNACFLIMSSKSYPRCKSCNEETTIFPLYRADNDFIMAWKENIFFEAWAFSLLKRNHIPCESNMTIFQEGIDIGEIDLLVNAHRKFIVEATKGRGVAQAAYELFGKDKLLGGGHSLMLLHVRKIDDKLKRIFRDIIIVDDAFSDLKFGDKFLNHFR